MNETPHEPLDPDAWITGQDAVIEADPKRPYKAIAAGVGGFIAGFLTYWVADADPFTAKDAGEAVVAGLLASGVTGGGTFLTRNPLRSRDLGAGPIR